VPYLSPVSGALFYFVNQRKTFGDAQKMCTTLGGHLASYSTLQEQVRAGASKISRSHAPGSSRQPLALQCCQQAPGSLLLVLLLLFHKTTQPIRLLAQESFRNAISKLQNIVYVILLVNHIHQATQVRIHQGQNVSKSSPCTLCG
jgi:hypothetical protein